MTKEELQNRLIDFAVSVIILTDSVMKNEAGIALIKQVVRSCTSPALNYGESIGAESIRDFVHKLNIVLKELRETWVTLTIIHRAHLCGEEEKLTKAIDENNQLISIFVKSVNTNRKKG
jgi:four helix bundle protein